MTCVKRVGSGWEREPFHLPTIYPRESVSAFTPHLTATHIHAVCPLSTPDYLAVEGLGICALGLGSGDLRSGRGRIAVGSVAIRVRAVERGVRPLSLQVELPDT